MVVNEKDLARHMEKSYVFLMVTLFEFHLVCAIFIISKSSKLPFINLSLSK